MTPTSTLFEQGSWRPVPLSDIGNLAAGGTTGFVWVHLDQPTAVSISELSERLTIPADVVRSITGRHNRPTLELQDEVAVVILKVVPAAAGTTPAAFDEISIVLGRRFVLTVMWSQGTLVEEVARTFEADGQTTALGGVGVLVAIASRVIDRYEQAIDRMNSEADVLEALVFSSDGRDHSEQIYLLKRRTAELRRSVVPLARGLERLARTELPWLLTMPGPVLQQLLDGALNASEDIADLDLLLSDVLQANVATVTAGQNRTGLRQNEDTRKISAWAAIALVPTVVTGVYGMNFAAMPELTWTFGYPAAVVLIVVLCVIVHRLFRRNHWL